MAVNGSLCNLCYRQTAFIGIVKETVVVICDQVMQEYFWGSTKKEQQQESCRCNFSCIICTLQFLHYCCKDIKCNNSANFILV